MQDMMMRNHKHCGPSKIALFLIIIGALNWGLVGFSRFFGQELNIVNILLDRWPMIEAGVYALVGIAGIVAMFHCRCKQCQACDTCSVEGSAESKM